MTSASVASAAAIAILERSIDRRIFCVTWVDVDPFFVREHPNWVLVSQATLFVDGVLEDEAAGWINQRPKGWRVG
jgi:hypothetical protein